MSEKPPTPPSDLDTPSNSIVPPALAVPVPLTPLSTHSSRAVVKYLSACLLLLSLCIVDFSIPYWFRYCDMNVGLISYEDYGFTGSFDAYVQSCESQDYDYCRGLCDRTKELRVVGGIVLGLGSASMFVLAVVMVRMLVFTVNPSRTYGERLVKWGLILSAVLWWAAVIPYLAIFAKIVNETDGKSTFVEGGIPLSLFIAVWHVISCPVGISLTKKQVAALPDVPQTESNQPRDQQEMDLIAPQNKPIGDQQEVGCSLTPDVTVLQYRRPAVVFACLSAVTIGAGITDFCLKSWVLYCGVETSLTTVYGDSLDATYGQTIEEVCPSDEYTYCGDICTDFKHLKDSSTVMLALGIPSMTVLAAVTVWMLVLAVKPVRQKRVCLARVGLVLAAVLWWLATIVYIALVVEIRIDTEEVELQVGLYLCFAVAVVQVGSCVVGNLALNKLIRY